MTRDQAPVGIYYCPTRRPAKAYPIQYQEREPRRAQTPVAAKVGLRNERWRQRQLRL